MALAPPLAQALRQLRDRRQGQCLPRFQIIGRDRIFRDRDIGGAADAIDEAGALIACHEARMMQGEAIDRDAIEIGADESRRLILQRQPGDDKGGQFGDADAPRRFRAVLTIEQQVAVLAVGDCQQRAAARPAPCRHEARDERLRALAVERALISVVDLAMCQRQPHELGLRAVHRRILCHG